MTPRPFSRPFGKIPALPFHTPKYSGGELERSVLSEYEERLERRRREVEELQQQRDKLLATQMRLQELQRNVTNSVSRVANLL